MFADLIQVWRESWGYDFPFIFVQLPNYGGEALNWDSRAESWAFIREAQAKALALPATEMAVTVDAGELLDIHPQNKRIVGAVASSEKYWLSRQK
jgi:sialate O-acetylesterase